jgi:hypothetical protein
LTAASKITVLTIAWGAWLDRIDTQVPSATPNQRNASAPSTAITKPTGCSAVAAIEAM